MKHYRCSKYDTCHCSENCFHSKFHKEHEFDENEHCTKDPCFEVNKHTGKTEAAYCIIINILDDELFEIT